MNGNRVLTIARAELRLAVRDLEQLLLAIGLPLILLVFFSQVDVLPVSTDRPIDFIAPGVVVLALLSVAFVRPAIALGFDRSFGAIKRFAVTPLRVSEFLMAKLLANLILFIGQLVLLVGVATILGWSPSITLPAVGALAVALVAFGAMAVVLSSLIDGLTSLAVANTLYILLLMSSGIVFDLEKLPGWLQAVARLLPTTALVSIVRSQVDLANFASQGATPWIVLIGWAVAASVLAHRLFRWE